jgi:predicted O-methyltransferase YrrM
MPGDIPAQMLKRMRQLEEMDRRDREDGTARLDRLRQIPPETGRFLATLAAGSPDGRLVEVGTSAGYSALWLALAARRTGRRLLTYETLEVKAALARETFSLAGVEDVVELIVEDAREHLPGLSEIGFCFLDAEKVVYADCYEAIVPNLVRGGILVADNAVSHAEALEPMLDRALSDDRVHAVVLPVGKGELVCVRRAEPARSRGSRPRSRT